VLDIEILGVTLGVMLGVILGVTLGVMLGVILGVGVTDILILGVILGVILGEGVGVGDILIEGVTLGVALGLRDGVRVGEGVGVGLGDMDGGIMILFGIFVIITIPCSYIILPTYSEPDFILPSPSSYKVPLTGLSSLNVLGLMLSPYNFEGIDIIPILSVENIFCGFKVVSSKL
jgi:hypothetical protein